MLIGVSSMHTKKYRGEHENRLFPISPLVEFYPIDLTLSRRAANWELFDANSSTYAAGLKNALEAHHGIYVFFDSRGKSIYVGKAKRQSLWMEMNSALNRKRKNLQRMMLVSHPSYHLAISRDRSLSAMYSFLISRPTSVPIALPMSLSILQNPC